MWKSLSRPQRLADGVDEGEAGHRLVRHLGIEADHVRVLERRDEVQRMPTVGRKMSPRGSLGLGSSAKRMS
jgi:hypothetical protein